jgi:hypothetical protein
MARPLSAGTGGDSEGGVPTKPAEAQAIYAGASGSASVRT